MGIIISTSKNNNNFVFVFSFPLFIPLPGGKYNFLHAKSRYKIGKSTLYIITSKSEMPTLAGNIQLFHPSLPSKDAPFPLFGRKWTDLIRRIWTSKRFFSRRHIVYSLGNCILHRWKILRITLMRKKNKRTKMEKWKKKIKYNIHDFNTKIHLITVFLRISSSVNLFVF